MNVFFEVGATFLVWIVVVYLVAIGFGVSSVMGYFLLKHGKEKIAEAITSLIK